MKIWANPKIVPDSSALPFFESLMRRMLAEYGENGLNNSGFLKSCLLTLLYELKFAYIPLPGANPSRDRLANSFRELIIINIKEKHSVADYAAMLNISPNHLNKVVKAATGKSPIVWIDETIVQEAKMLMSQSRISLSEVATEVGIIDQSYFTRIFKKYEGITPSAYRNLQFSK